MTLVIISDGIDLSVGPTAALSAVIGAILLGALRNGLTLMNVQAFYQLLAIGIIIRVAMLINRATRRR